MYRRKMMSRFVEMQLPDLPRGYEYKGVYRKPVHGDYYLDRYDRVDQWDGVPKDKGPSYPIIRKLKWEPSEGEMVWYANLQLIDVRSIKYDSRLMKEGYDRGLIYRTDHGAETALELMLDAISDINFNDEED
jgi:hypothetical protein